jgi:hypothetical protein
MEYAITVAFLLAAVILGGYYGVAQLIVSAH